MLKLAGLLKENINEATSTKMPGAYELDKIWNQYEMDIEVANTKLDKGLSTIYLSKLKKELVGKKLGDVIEKYPHINDEISGRRMPTSEESIIRDVIKPSILDKSGQYPKFLFTIVAQDPKLGTLQLQIRTSI